MADARRAGDADPARLHPRPHEEAASPAPGVCRPGAPDPQLPCPDSPPRAEAGPAAPKSIPGSSPRLRLTVATCTWNRAALLARLLERLTQLAAPAAAWELVVVNNNCSDHTERVLDRFAERLPLRRVFEPEPGLSHARNAAIGHATGDYILWTDDDALPDRDWLCAYERAVRRWPDAAVFGGPVRPDFEGRPPAWLATGWPQVQSAFAVLDLGREPLPLDGHGRLPFGANFAVRGREQRRFAYDPALGRKRTGGTLGEETAVIRAILAAGGTGQWVPDAAVDHWVPRERQTVAYLRDYYALYGRTAMHERRPGAPPGSWRRLGWHWRRAVRMEVRYRLIRLSGNPRRWLPALADAATLWGACRR